MIELVRVNQMDSCYMRPIVLRGYGDVGVLPFNNPMEVYIACWEWGKYLGEDALAKGVDVCVSSWTRIAPNTLPALAKAGANYMNSQLIRMEAQINGYAEGIALDERGLRQRRLRRKHFRGARWQNSDAAAGRIRAAGHHPRHRDAARRIARNSAGRDTSPARDALHCRRSVLLAEPRRRSRRSARWIASSSEAARADPMTEKLQKAFFDVINGDAPDRFGWLTPVAKNEPVTV